MATEKTTYHCKMCPFARPASAADTYARAGGCDRVCFYMTIVYGERTPIECIPEHMRDTSTVH